MLLIKGNPKKTGKPEAAQQAEGERLLKALDPKVNTSSARKTKFADLKACMQVPPISCLCDSKVSGVSRVYLHVLLA